MFKLEDDTFEKIDEEVLKKLELIEKNGESQEMEVVGNIYSLHIINDGDL